MKTITVNASKTYEVMIGNGLLDRAGELIMDRAGGKVAAIVTDDMVDALYAKRLENALRDTGYMVVKYVLPHGERSKNAAAYVQILNFLAENRLSRKDVVIALGGGVVGDIAGFAAASYMRGICLIQVPTTLLAAVDSSVGGKTAINLEAGKNLAGAFYQPELVICDYSTLDTLSLEIFSDGCAEIVKYGMIADENLFHMLNSPVRPQVEAIIARSVEIKRDVVCADERESGARQMLNFGHTFGHAIEKCSNYTMTHGKAVAIGMAIITRAAVYKGLCDPTALTGLNKILDSLELPAQTGYGEQDLFDALLMDKKRSGTHITLVIPRRIGSCQLHKLPLTEVKEYLQVGLGTGGE
jgi:3-dehydroquinate synthase